MSTVVGNAPRRRGHDGGGARVVPAALLAVSLALAVTHAARGEVYQFTFGGVIEESSGNPIPPAPWEFVGIGTAWEFSIVFDSEAEDLIPFNDSRGFWNGISGAVRFDDVPVTTWEWDVFEIMLDLDSPFDDYQVSLGDVSANVGGGIFLRGVDVFADDSLPLDLKLDDFTFTFFQFGFGPDTTSVSGSVMTFSSRIVPAPACALPLTLYVASGVRQRRRRS